MASKTTGQPPEDSGLARRLVWLTAARLLFLTLALTLIGVFYLQAEFHLGAFSARVLILNLAIGFVFAGICAAALRRRGSSRSMCYAQLVADQALWSVVVYLTGGASSGATSFYGLSCLIGAILLGLSGAVVAAIAGGSAYLVIAVGLHQGWFPIPTDQARSLYVLSGSEVVYYLLANLLVLVVVVLLGGYLAERLRATGGQLIQAKERADHAERFAAFGRLAAGLAHEIRNPLGAIAGSIQLVQASAQLGVEDRKLCSIIQREAARLSELVDDMMGLVRARPPNMEIVDCCYVARDVVGLISRAGRARDDVRVEFNSPVELRILADGSQLKQLIWNLVRNAIQASQAGERVQVEIARREGDIWLEVRDTGMGLDPEARERLFDAMYTTRSQGTGIGLAVVKRIADEHGFEIHVESEIHRGACFRVNLGSEQAVSQFRGESNTRSHSTTAII